MKIVLFFARVTFICNISFLLFVYFRWLELSKHPKHYSDRIIAVPLFKDMVITLGFTAIVINFIMNIVCLSFMVAGYRAPKKEWIVIVNFAFLILQAYYFFFY